MSLILTSFKRLHYPVDVIAQCVRWYLAYALSLREDRSADIKNLNLRFRENHY